MIITEKMYSFNDISLDNNVSLRTISSQLTAHSSQLTAHSSHKPSQSKQYPILQYIFANYKKSGLGIFPTALFLCLGGT